MITKIAVVTKVTETTYFSNKNDLINYLITESEVVTWKSQTEALPYWPSDSEVNKEGQGLRFSRNNRAVEVIKSFIIWHRQQK